MPSSRNALRGASGFVFSAVDSLWGFCKGTWRAVSAWSRGESYFYSDLDEDTQDRPDRTPEREASGIATGSRVLGVGATVLVILGFVGAVCIPLPGTGPIYAASVAGGFKAAGITMGWSAVGRGIGSFLGGIVDFFTLKSRATTQTRSSVDSRSPVENRPSSTSSILRNVATTALATTVMGEPGLNYFENNTRHAQDRQRSTAAVLTDPLFTEPAPAPLPGRIQDHPELRLPDGDAVLYGSDDDDDDDDNTHSSTRTLGRRTSSS